MPSATGEYDPEPGTNPFGASNTLSASEPWAITSAMKVYFLVIRVVAQECSQMKYDNVFNEQKLTSGGKVNSLTND